jgi:hypothetical protein
MKESEIVIICRAECCEVSVQSGEQMSPRNFPIYRVALRPGVRLMAQAATRRLKALSAEWAILGWAGLARERWRALGCPLKLGVDIGDRHD